MAVLLVKLKKILKEKNQLILWLAIALYIVVIFALCSFKYFTFDYNALDLGIYNQVFYNTSQGDFWQLTIHPHLYLGDHFELIILLLAPIYFIFQSPLTLLFLQTLFIGLAAWPLYLITKNILGKNWALFFSLIYLLNPFVLNANFFEFHILPLAIFFLLFTYYFYQKKRFVPFVIFCLLSLLIREDISLIIFMFGILALVEKRKPRWALWPIIAGGIWFIASFNLIGYFNQYGTYKFISLYLWLGGSTGEIIKNFFLKPGLVFIHLISLNNIIFVIGLLLPFLGLPFLRPKYLLPSLFIFAQLFLLNTSGVIILQTHYNSPLIPFLFIASIYSVSWIINPRKVNSLRKINSLKSFILRQKMVFLVILVTAVVYSFLTFSPVLPLLGKIIKYPQLKQETELKNNAVQLVDNKDTVVSSYDFLAHLSGRENIYSLHYAFLGKKQFTDENFILPDKIDKVVINFEDFIIYLIQSQNLYSYQEQYPTGDQRIKDLLQEKNLRLSHLTDTIGVYQKDYHSEIKLYEIIQTIKKDINQKNANLDGKIKFIGWEENNTKNSNQLIGGQIVPLTFYWQPLQKIENDYQLQLELIDEKNKSAYQKYYPLAYGLYPTRRWNKNEIVKINYWFSIPEEFKLEDHQIKISLVHLNGFLELDKIGSAIITITNQEQVGESIIIDYNTL